MSEKSSRGPRYKYLTTQNRKEFFVRRLWLFLTQDEQEGTATSLGVGRVRKEDLFG